MKDEKGHGSDARGGEADHQSGVKVLGREIPVASKVLDIIRNSPNGFSVTPSGSVPTSGYMVSLSGHSAYVPLGALAGPRAREIIQNYVNANAALFANQSAHIGGWHDTNAGHVVLDVSHNMQNRTEAIRTGRDRNQIAIYDIKHGKEIKTGGTGDKR